VDLWIPRYAARRAAVSFPWTRLINTFLLTYMLELRFSQRCMWKMILSWIYILWRIARQQTDKHHATIGLRFPLLGSVKRQWSHWVGIT
jgi:hypothetical protein